MGVVQGLQACLAGGPDGPHYMDVKDAQVSAGH